MIKKKRSNHNKNQNWYKNIDMPLCYFWRAIHGNRGDERKKMKRRMGHLSHIIALMSPHVA